MHLLKNDFGKKLTPSPILADQEANITY